MFDNLVDVTPLAFKKESHVQSNGNDYHSEKIPYPSWANVPTPPKSPRLTVQVPNTALFSNSVAAKIWGIALKGLEKRDPPTEYPEYTDRELARYVYTPKDFWTAGFFPGSIYLLYERRTRWPQSQIIANFPEINLLKLKHACKWWTSNLHVEATRTDTHDLGFMVMPWAEVGWTLDGDEDCYRSMVSAAYALASRYNEKVQAIRSWDRCFTKSYSYDDPKDAFLVIIDSLMNLNLLFYVSNLVQNPFLARIAHTHATTLLKSHIREDWSTFHVVDFNQDSGTIKQRFTNQGYADDSCWSRGQAWAITGFAQTYGWTKDARFLDASRQLADYFIDHLPEDQVAFWDFDAPKPGPRDTSAALAAAYGMLLLHQHLQPLADSKYLASALRIIDGVVAMSMAPPAQFTTGDNGKEAVEFDGAESVVLDATINNHEFAPRRWAGHGLVYADYFFLLIGNTLAKMGLV